MKVTIIVPTYKRLEYLSEAIESVLQQTHTNWTCTIVNDYPADNQAISKMIADFNDRRLVLIDCQVSIGGNAARNRGIEQAKGEIIAFLDDDDLWLSNKLEKHLDLHRQNPETGVIFSGVIQEWERAILPPKTTLATLPKGKVTEAMSRGLFCPHSTSCVTVRRECFIECGMFDRDLVSFQDWDMWFRIARVYPFDCISEPLIIFRQHLGDRTSKSVQRRLQGMSQIISKWREELDDPENFQKIFTKEVYVTHINRAILQKDRSEAISYWQKLLQISQTKKDFLQLIKLAVLFVFGINVYQQLLQGFRYFKLDRQLE